MLYITLDQQLATALDTDLDARSDDLLAGVIAGDPGVILRHEPIDLADLATTEAHRLQPLLGLHIQVSGHPTVVPGDPDRLRQILANLAHNSATAGSTTMRVHITTEEESARLEITDNGPGFPPDIQDSAFERFVRGTPTRSPDRTSGAGLGLSIVRAVVTAHGGTVHARNDELHGGAVVTVRLPTG